MEISATIIGTILFVFFMLPGFLFLRILWKNRYGDLTSENFYNYVLWSTLISTLIYSIIYFPINLILPLQLQQLVNLINSNESHSFIEINLENEVNKTIPFRNVLIFCLTCSGLGALLAYSIQIIVFKYKLDLKYPFLKFRNEWFYSFTARDKKGFSLNFNDGVMLHLICEIGESVIIYRGILFDYKVRENNLEYVHLYYVWRTGITQWEAAQSTFSQITMSPAFIPKGAAIFSGGPITAAGNIVNEGYMVAKGDVKAKGLIKNSGIIKAEGYVDGDEIIVEQNINNPPQPVVNTDTNQNHPNFKFEDFSKSLNDINENPLFYEIPDEFMIFKASEIKNIHVSYL